ncbi:MAG: 2,3-bisphosphoglycerate-independent phosphoglycerate mutase [Candidatus Aenigmatarchaeota archaeon]
MPKKRSKPVSKRKKKVVFIVVDGMADLPINNKTPLSEANKPNLDWLTKNGVSGELVTVDKSIWKKEGVVGSHTAAISLLGGDVKNNYIKRGPIEAVGADQTYHDGQLAIRCNFATVDRELAVLDRRAGRNSFGLDEISRYINEHLLLEVQFIFRRTFGHRAVLIFRDKLSDKISTNDPHFVGEKVKRIEPLDKEAEATAKIVQEFVDKSRSLIEYHPSNEARIRNGIRPANYLLIRQAGNKLPKVPQFLKKHRLEKGVVIAESGVMKGVGMLAGLDSITVPEMKFESYMKFIFDNIQDALTEYDFIFVHILGPDEPAHDGDFHRKREMIERIDQRMDMFKDFDGILVFTADHITATKLRAHAEGAVPVMIYGKGKDKIKKFDEFSVKKGKLKLTTPIKLWKYVFGK